MSLSTTDSKHILVIDCVNGEANKSFVHQQLVQSDDIVGSVIKLGQTQQLGELTEHLVEQAHSALVIYTDSYAGIAQVISRTIVEKFSLPVILLTEDKSPTFVETALQDGVSAYHHKDVGLETLLLSIHVSIIQFNQTQELKKELNKVRTSLVERKTVERAKGILMRQRTIDEDLAYKMLRTQAMNQGKKMVDIAQGIISSQQSLS